MSPASQKRTLNTHLWGIFVAAYCITTKPNQTNRLSSGGYFVATQDFILAQTYSAALHYILSTWTLPLPHIHAKGEEYGMIGPNPKPPQGK